MFQFPAFPVHDWQEMNPARFPDLGHPRIKACLAAPRGFSQLGHDLLRLWTPRHPPCTLSSLTTLFLELVADALLEPSCFQRTTPSRRGSGRPLRERTRVVEATGLEPTTLWLQTRCSTS